MTLKGIRPFETGALVGFVVLSVLASSCSKSSSASLNFPAIAPIVQKSLPAKLQATASAVVFQPARSMAMVIPHLRSTITPSNSPTGEMTNAGTYIQSLFTNSYNNSDNGQASPGLINMLVTTIDLRMSGVETQVSGFSSTPSCLSAAPTSYTVDLSNIDPMLKMTFRTCNAPILSAIIPAAPGCSLAATARTTRCR